MIELHFLVLIGIFCIGIADNPWQLANRSLECNICTFDFRSLLFVMSTHGFQARIWGAQWTLLSFKSHAATHESTVYERRDSMSRKVLETYTLQVVVELDNIFFGSSCPKERNLTGHYSSKYLNCPFSPRNSWYKLVLFPSNQIDFFLPLLILLLLQPKVFVHQFQQ